MWYIYILKSLKDGKHYIGSTSSVEERLKRHNAGRNTSTKHRRPFVLVLTETYNSEKEAVAREYQIKRYKGGQAFQELVPS